MTQPDLFTETIRQVDEFLGSLARKRDPHTSHEAEWRKIVGASSYSVSSDGSVRRDEKKYRTPPGLVKIKHDRLGYPRCSIAFDDGKSRNVTVHLLLARAFIGPCADGQMVRHWDGNPLNCNIVNLLYGTSQDNVRDAIRHGTQVRGERQHLAKLTDSAVVEIIEQLAGGVATRLLAERYGVSAVSIDQIRKGATWTHIQRPENPLYRPTKTGLIGAARRKKDGRYVAMITVDGRRKWLGSFSTPEESHAAYMKALHETTGMTRSGPSGRQQRVWRAA